MKRLIFLLPLCLLMPLSVFPQMGLGVAAGISYSDVLSKGDDGTINRLPYLAYTRGLTSSYTFNDRWLLTYGISIDRNGFKVQFYSSDAFGKRLDGPYDITQRLNYLTFPILLNIHSGTKVQLYTGLGVHLSVLLSAVSIEPLLEPLYDQNGVPLFRWNLIGEARKPVTDSYKPLNVSLAWQGGIRYLLATNLLLDIKIGLAQGVMPITKEDKFQNVMYYISSGAVHLGVLYKW